MTRSSADISRSASHGPRAALPAMRRGFLGRCPNCGQGHIFERYLKVRPACEACGEAFHHHRADDAPPYVTLLIVTHVFGFIMVAVLTANEEMPVWLQAILWPALVLGLSLTLLPRVKGALIALQWALRMHGFGGTPEGKQPDAPQASRAARPKPLSA